MGSIGHPCRTIQGSARYLSSLMTVQALRMRPSQQPMQYCSRFEGVSVFDQAVLLLPCWTNNHCPRPELNVVIQTLLALLHTASIDKAFLVIGMQFSISKMIKRRHNSITLCPIDRTDYHFRNRWA